MAADKNQTRFLLEELRARLHVLNRQYYIEDKPGASDGEYDALFAELLSLEAAHPDLVSRDSPSQRVGAPLSGRFIEVTHGVAMLSLNNANTAQERASFFNRVEKESAHVEAYFCEPKLDGLAISLTYDNGHLVRAATRGDGHTGEDVSHTVRTIKDVPLRLSRDVDGRVQVRGEVVLPLKAFARMNLEAEQEGKRLFANPRNACAGTIRQLDPKVAAARALSFFAYALVGEEGGPFRIPTQKESLDFLEELGFRVNSRNAVCTSTDEVERYIADIERQRADLPYEIDGVVVKVNSLATQNPALLVPPKNSP